MAVTSKSTMQRAATASAKMDEVTYEAPWRFKVSDPLDGPGAIFTYLRTNGPWFGDSFSYGNDTDNAAKLVEWSSPTRERGSDSVWVAVAKYTTRVDQDQQKPDTNGDPTDWPLDWRPEVSVSWAQHEKVCQKARYRGGFTHAPARFTQGEFYTPQNSALEIFDPPLMMDLSRATFRITFWRDVYNMGTASSLIDVVNEKTVAWRTFTKIIGGCGPYTLKCADVQGSPKREAREHPTLGRVLLDYMELVVELQYNREGWRDKINDRGLRRIVQAGDDDGFGGTVSLVDLLAQQAPPNRALLGIDGHPVSGPVLLDGAGNPKQATDRVPVEVTWQKYDEASYVANDYLNLVLEIP